ncbi:MAG: hypothetical protein AAGC58_08825 [Asticcacaulis sp.]
MTYEPDPTRRPDPTPHENDPETMTPVPERDAVDDLISIDEAAKNLPEAEDFSDVPFDDVDDEEQGRSEVDSINEDEENQDAPV